MKSIIVFLLALLFTVAAGWRVMIWMPGESFQGEVSSFTDLELEVAAELRRHVEILAAEIGERNYQNYAALVRSRDYIADRLGQNEGRIRLYDFDAQGLTFTNIEFEISGSSLPEEIIVAGAHYDTHPGTPGANDNGSGVAALLVLARMMSESESPSSRTVRFVAFPNEEMPFFSSSEMGSRVYARRSRKNNEDILAMLSLETMGYYSTRPASQYYPQPLSLLYPDRGDFIAFVSDIKSSALLRQSIKVFRENVDFPSQGAALPRFTPGVGWSDHSSFWKEGYRAFMVTDTAPFRYPYYHHPEDLPDKIDYNRLARVVIGLKKVILELSH